MGWRDINMNRRKPRLDVAVVPRGEGEDHGGAVLRKAAQLALAALNAQGQGAVDPGYRRFIAGYLAGHARQGALKHGIDAEENGLSALLPALVNVAPASLQDAIATLSFSPHEAPSSRRTRLRAEDDLADAGYLVGHLEALCGTKRLLPAGRTLEAYLTACDTAADRMQTHLPTASLRFDAGERAVVAAAMTQLSGR